MSAEVSTFDSIKSLLRHSKQIGAIKVDLFTHITEIINRIIAHHKYDAYQKFEEISLLIKKTQLNYKNAKTKDDVDRLYDATANAELEKYVNSLRDLLNDKIPLSPDDKAIVSKTHKCAIGDFLEKSKMLQWAGISFGDEETYRIYKSMNKLAILTGAKSMRFWGKFFARKRDYYVIEGEVDYFEELALPYHFEPRGKGVNKNVYWVTTSLLDDWIQLPDANPDHLKAAKMFKHNNHILSGDLNAVVNTNPPFTGKERHFLRTQIARISHATTLCPKGLVEPDEEKEGELKYAEEFNLPGTAELNSTEAWCHHYPNILNAGRITHLRPQGIPDDEADEILAKLEEEDKVLEKLMGINEDVPIPPLESAYLLKVVGDDQPYNPDEGEEGNVIYSANVIKSLKWPGAYTVAYGGSYMNIYLGHGLKYGDKSYYPITPPEIMKDPDEKAEQPEPTPLEAPEEPLEPDTDEEAKKPEDE